jgi:5-(aminomethyl)-3-furanmethanol phosphate kinase
VEDVTFGPVIKIGGSLLEDAAAFAVVVETLDALPGRMSRTSVPLIVPGGGPFADAVRAVDGHLGVGDDAAHWMAVLAMEQTAHLLAARTRFADLVVTPAAAVLVHRAQRLPIIAPYHWLRERDPLPHSWAVTSDSIAAWIAAELRATELVLVKRFIGPAEAVTDRYFSTVVAEASRSGRTLRVRITDARLISPDETPTLRSPVADSI